MEDMNHPMGGAPMNISPEKKVNTNLELIKYPNIFLFSAVIFPSGSDSNPTMNVLALSNRLAE